jgi:hypothetical protein
MRWVFFAVFLFLNFPQVAAAQPVDNSTLDIVEAPICFALRNTADYTVFGKFSTAKYTRPDGVVTRHRSNFRLEPAGSVDEKTGEKTDRSEYCTYGPFLPDRQLILTIRTLVPVFECNTRVDTGQEIVIKGARKADDSGVDTWAECFNADGSKSGRPAE